MEIIRQDRFTAEMNPKVYDDKGKPITAEFLLASVVSVAGVTEFEVSNKTDDPTPNLEQALNIVFTDNIKRLPNDYRYREFIRWSLKRELLKIVDGKIIVDLPL